MSVSHGQNSGQLEYTLPGIMHYLQKETTKNERDRIQWESERGELKCKISKLEGENKSLHEQVSRLQSELSAAKKSNKSHNKDVSKIQFKEFDINPLAQAREKLQSQIREIGVLLNSTPVEFAKSELSGERSYFASNPGLHHDESTAESSLNSNQAPVARNTTNLPDSISLSENSNISTSDDISKNTLIKNNTSPPPVTTPPVFIPETQDIESDTETVTDELEEKPTTQHHKVSEKFILSSHVSTITSLSMNDKELLGAAKDGVIKLWPLGDILNSVNSDVKPSITFRGEPNPIRFVKWIDQEWFVTVSSAGVKFWHKSSTSPKNKYSAMGNTSADANESYIAHVAKNGQLSVCAIFPKTDKIHYEHLKDINGNCKFVALSKEEKSTLIKVSQDGVDIVDLKNKKSKAFVSDHLQFGQKTITNFSIEGTLWSFILDNVEVVLFHPTKKNITFRQTYDVEIANVKVNPKHIVVFLTDGDIKVYESKNTSQIFKDYNIYKLFLSDYSKLSKEDKVTLKNSLKTGELVWTDYVFAGCEDSFIRGFKIE